MAHVLADTLELSLPAFDTPPYQSQPVTEMSDVAVLALTNLELSSANDKQLTLLLGKQQAGTLTD